MKIARYKVLSCNIVTTHEVSDYIERSDDHVRLTEIVDVEFTPLSDPELIKDQVDSTDKAIERAEAKMADLKRHKETLLAISNAE